MTSYYDDKIGFTITIPKKLYEDITKQMKLDNRSRNKQVIHWLYLGKLLDSNKDIATALMLKDQLQ